MEKFSRFRDPGTGIQVFLPPVPPAGAVNAVSQILTPFALLVGAVRAMMLALTIAIWALLETLFGSVSRPLQSGLIAVFGRITLFWCGFVYVRAEVVSLKKRGKAGGSARPLSSIKPEKGSIIVSNWSSWIDVLYLAILFNPTFLAPVVAPAPHAGSAQASPSRPGSSGSAKTSPAATRRRNAGASVVEEVNNSPGSLGPSSRLLGFRQVSLWDMLRLSGETPMVREDKNGKQVFKDIVSLAEKASGPVCIFPELVTSNNRGLLRMTPVFPISWRAMFRATGELRLGAGQPQIYVVAIKHAAPAPQSPSSVLTVPSASLNPLAHAWTLSASLNLSRSLQVRILDPDESPTSPSFTPDPTAATTSAPDPISELCANFVAQLSRLRRTGLGWEDKEAFLQMYRERRKT